VLAHLVFCLDITSSLVRPLRAWAWGQGTHGLILLAWGVRCRAWGFEFGLGQVVVAYRVVWGLQFGVWGFERRGSS